MTSVVEEIEMNEDNFMQILTKLISEAENLQNNPQQNLIPQETLAARHVLDALLPYSTEHGGPLEVQLVEFVSGRGNVIIKYPGNTNGVISFVGSHLDVVPANKDGWQRDPFRLTREDDLVYGRGTTDCLGHVALLTDFLITLAKQRPILKNSIVVVFIANEENGTFKGVGVDQLSKEHYLDDLRNGPVFWIDAADSQPCLGTAGNVQWKLTHHGKLFHSGMPHKTINPIEFAMDAFTFIQQRFYEHFPRDPREDTYNFTTSSTMKPTQIACTPGSLNQIPPTCTIEGDVRVSPFYDVADVKRAISNWVDEINENPSLVGEVRGPHSKYVVPAMNIKGKIELHWITEGDNGIACNINSSGYRALLEATKDVLGAVQPYSIGGSLPLVRELQDEGFDIQISGFGQSARYHADNECASIKDYKKAVKIIALIVSKLEVNS